MEQLRQEFHDFVIEQKKHNDASIELMNEINVKVTNNTTKNEEQDQAIKKQGMQILKFGSLALLGGFFGQILAKVFE